MSECKYCHMAIEWTKRDGKNVPIDPTTGQAHRCQSKTPAKQAAPVGRACSCGARVLDQYQEGSRKTISVNLDGTPHIHDEKTAAQIAAIMDRVDKKAVSDDARKRAEDKMLESMGASPDEIAGKAERQSQVFANGAEIKAANEEEALKKAAATITPPVEKTSTCLSCGHTLPEALIKEGVCDLCRTAPADDEEEVVPSSPPMVILPECATLCMKVTINLDNFENITIGVDGMQSDEEAVEILDAILEKLGTKDEPTKERIDHYRRRVFGSGSK